MVSGRQYDRFIENVGEFVDLSEYFYQADEQWRQNPTFNWLSHYYKLTLSKLTENLPAMGFIPAGADFNDAVLAELMEPVFKYEWRQMKMPQNMFPLYGWVILAGRAVTKIRWDPDRGPADEFKGPAFLDFLEGNSLTQRELSDAPYIRNNEGLFEPNVMRDEGLPVFGEGGGFPEMGAPHTERAGDLAFDVLAPTSVISPHGPEWFEDKPWYTHEYLMPVEDVERRFPEAKNVEPDDIEVDDIADMWMRLSYGENYGMASSLSSESVEHLERKTLQGYKRIREHWRRDVPNHPVLGKGRTIVVPVADQDEVYYDDINPFWVDGSHEVTVMPFDAWDGVLVPFRNEGMSDFEQMNPVQRALNRREAGLLDAVEHNEQPIRWRNENTTQEEDEPNFNKPGFIGVANLSPNAGPPMHTEPAPQLPDASVIQAGRLREWLMLLGSQPLGAEGTPATKDASGELQREVRFDTDRVWGATIRLHSYGWARVAEKIGQIIGSCMDDSRVVTLSGEDNAAQFLNIGGQVFRGSVHAVPNPESQVLESRQEKQNRIAQLVQTVGMPPEVALKALNYPDVNRALRPGGAANSMARRENVELMLGTLSQALPKHDHAIHKLVHLEQMQTAAFRDADPQIQQLFGLHVMMHEEMEVLEAIRQGQLAMKVQGALMPPPVDETGQPTGGGSAQPLNGEANADLQRGAGAPGQADPGSGQLQLQA